MSINFTHENLTNWLKSYTNQAQPVEQELDMKPSRSVYFDGRRVDLVVVDAMFTLFQPRGVGKDRMVCDAYRAPNQLNARDISDARILRSIKQNRRRFKSLNNDEDYWNIVNQFVHKELGARHYSEPRGRATREMIIAEPSLYRVNRPLKKLIAELRRNGVRVVIGSNHRQKALRKFVRHFRLNKFLDGLYTSEEFDLRKPSPEFWKKILELEGVDPERVVHIGNSPNSDTGAAELGIHVIILDPMNRLQLLKDVQELDLPDQDPETLQRLVSEGLVKVHTRVSEARARFTTRLS